MLGYADEQNPTRVTEAASWADGWVELGCWLSGAMLLAVIHIGKARKRGAAQPSPACSLCTGYSLMQSTSFSGRAGNR
ncbi:hypothetical protein A3K78_09070 [Candidatus Bathyarchaeota archaeon RBG_13_52_12]|nr:MAG: hypothetical protein A3K78_09070 [Candidatus Bathyarchaeota archaeon RBG_13_52_12]